MNFRDLKYLVALVDHRHFGKAAEACFVTQPALSMQLKKLEEYLDIRLIERTNKSVILTQHGAILAERARDILNQIEDLKILAKSIRDPFSGELRVGIIPTLAPYYLPLIMPSIHRTFPKLNVFLVEAQTAVLLQQLKDGKIDTAVLALPVSDTSLHTHHLFTEEFMLGVPFHHALAKRKTIKHNELSDHTLLLLEEGHCLREHALHVCHTMNAKESAEFRATSLETLRHMVANGTGMTLFPKLAKQAQDHIAYLNFANPKPARDIGMVWRKSSTKEKVLTAMAQLMKKQHAG